MERFFMSCNNCSSKNSCSNACASGACTSSQPHCGKCCGGSCSEAGSREIALSPLELSLLQLFSVYPFLPAARDRDGMPVYFPDASDMSASATDISACLQALEAKQIISVDDDIPIAGYDYSAYSKFPIRGSMALTAFGQDVLDSLIYQNPAPQS